MASESKATDQLRMNDGGAAIFVNHPSRSHLVLPVICHRIIHTKVKRRLCGIFGSYRNEKEFHLSSKVLDTLSIVAMWSLMNGTNGGPKTGMERWSGYTRRWKESVTYMLDRCIELGYLEKVKYVKGRGERICFTPKGAMIVKKYNECWANVLKEIEALIEKHDLHPMQAVYQIAA